jgi:predicted NBD/HSP70 family sugar kinase
MGIRFSIDDVFPDGRARRTDFAKARIFFAISDEQDGAVHTRKSLTEGLGLRPATVSAMVSELIQDNLVEETERLAAVGKGRPETSLGPLADRIVTPVIQVDSLNVTGALVNLCGRAIAETATTLDGGHAGPEHLIGTFRDIARELLAQRPEGAEVPGIGVALPGIVDERRLRWISAARWPRLSDLDFHRLADETGYRVRIERKRQAELRARFLTHPEEREGDVLFVSWAYGISSAYAQNGSVVTSSMGGFGDLGHWFVEPDSDKECLCGQNGCLEAHAALWALLPAIAAAFPGVSSQPESIASVFRDNHILHIPEVERATRLFAMSLHNLFKAFFPGRIVLSGYFLQNPGVAQRVRELFFGHLPTYAKGRVFLEVSHSSAHDAIIGVATPFFHQSLRPHLIARNARI